MRSTSPTPREIRERGRGRLDPQLHRLAEELQAPRSSAARPAAEVRLAQHLEAVADTDDRTAGAGVLADRVHHRREARDRAGAEIVAVRETAGYDDRVDTLGRVVAVPEQLGRPAELLDRELHVELAVRSREHCTTPMRTVTR